jgi:group I intron endonuclease
MRGIYAITNVLTDTVYYGQSVDMKARLSQHRHLLERDEHTNPILQNSWNKHGGGAFVFAPLYLIPDGDMTAREQSCCDGAYGMGLRVFNCFRPEDAPFTGRQHTPETVAKIRAALRGRSFGHKFLPGHETSDETRLRMSVALSGRKSTEATRAKVSAALLGNKHNLGNKATDETRQKMSAAQCRRVDPRGPGSFLGRHHSAESIAKMSAAKIGNTCAAGNQHGLGRHPSVETREKMSVAQTRAWANGRKHKNG